LQALNLLNDPVFVEAAQGLAFRLLTEAPTDRIDHAFKLTIGRAPTAREKERFAAYIDAQSGILSKDTAAAEALMPAPPDGVSRLEAATWTAASRVLLNLDEFITRE
jgi:hypothetical protein